MTYVGVRRDQGQICAGEDGSCRLSKVRDGGWRVGLEAKVWVLTKGGWVVKRDGGDGDGDGPAATGDDDRRDPRSSAITLGSYVTCLP